MSFVGAGPGAMAAAATNVAGIGATISAANAVAALPTTSVLAAAGDQVSAAVAAFFAGHARGYQAIGEQAASFHTQFVNAIGASANAYAATEEANASHFLDDGEHGNPAIAAGRPVGHDGGRGSGTSGHRGGSGRAAVPTGTGGSGPAGGSQSTEAGTPGVNGGSGGLLCGAGTVNGAAVRGLIGASRTGGAGGLLSRLLDVDDRRDRSSLGRLSARTGVLLPETHREDEYGSAATTVRVTDLRTSTDSLVCRIDRQHNTTAVSAQ